MLNYTSFLNSTNSSMMSGLEFAKGYAFSLPNLIQQGDLAAIIISLILFFLFLVIVNKLSTILLAVIKRTITFVITFLILFKYIPLFIDKIALEGFTLQNVVIGLIGIVLCLTALVISSIALFKDAKKALHKKQKIEKEQKPAMEIIQEHDTVATDIPYTFESIKQDKSLHNLVIYMIVAQFGVFSSVTMAAPNFKVGVSLLAIFFVASLVFIKQSYQNYKRGLFHLGIAIVLGFSLSLVLGIFWGNHVLLDLLSIDYFSSDALVALVTGMAVSLFAGSKS